MKHDNLVVFVQDPHFFNCLKKSPLPGNVSFLGKADHSFAKLLKVIVFARIKLLYLFIRHKLKLWSVNKANLSPIKILVFSWMFENSFDKDLNFVDPYLGDLKPYLEQKGENVARLGYLFFSNDLIDKLKRSGEKAVIHLQFVSWWQILRLFARIFSFKFEGLECFDGSDISLLLQREIYQENVTSDFISTLIFYHAVVRIVSQADSLQAIIHPFEGQPWEKLLFKAVKQVRPVVKVAGYQHSSFSPLLLNYFLGSGETNFAPLPDLILANSDYNKKRLVEGGFSAVRVKNIGAFRFDYLFNIKSSLRQGAIIKNSILVCLPYNRKLALDMLADIIPVLSKLQEAGVISEIKIKFHPLVPIDLSLLKNGKKFLELAQLVSGDLKQLLPVTDILLYCNGTISIEGLYFGKKLIKYLPELEVDLDSLAGLEKECGISVSHRGDLGKVLGKVISKNDVDQQVPSLKSMFDPVDYNNIDLVFDLGQSN